MAIFNLKSTIISNRDATPKVLTDSYVSGGDLKSSQGYVQTGSAADSATSTYKLAQIPSNGRVDQVLLSNDILGAGGAVNVGVFWPTFMPIGAGLNPALAGTAIIANFFASAFSVATAASQANVTNQSTQNTIAKQELPIWAALGLTSDPGIELDVVVSVSTVLAAQGFIGAKVSYTK